MLELILLLLLIYFVSGLLMYAYAVFKNWEITGFWSFKIKDGYIGLGTYPRWLLFWLEWIYTKLSK